MLIKTINEKQYAESEEIKNIANKFIENEDILKNSYIKEAKIAYFLVFPFISKKTIARIIKTNIHTKLYSNFDYIIEISGDFWNSIDKSELKEIIILHELLHINIIYNKKKGIFVYKLQDHNVKDFCHIISKYGIEWLDNVKTLFKSVYDLSEISSGEIKL